jgi:mRNA interferase MazF
MQRGDIYFADLNPVVGSEQGGTRPVLIVQNDLGNKHSPTVIVAAITSNTDKTQLPTHIKIDESCGLSKKSVVLLEQIRTIDKKRISNKVGRLSKNDLEKVDEALAISIGV